MLRTLLALLNDTDLQCRVRKAYNEVVKPFINFGSSFEVAYKTENSSFRRTFTETLPTDADLDTLTARVDNGVLTVTVDKLPEPAPEPKSEPEANSVDPTHVEIKRKRK